MRVSADLLERQLQIARALLTWPKFSRTSFRLVNALRRQEIAPRTVIDVGANAGQFAVAAAKLLAPAKLYAFEAIPEVCERLKKNTAAIPESRRRRWLWAKPKADGSFISTRTAFRAQSCR